MSHWNKLPNEIISANNVNQFKNNYDKHCILLNKKEIATIAGFQVLPGYIDDF